MKATYSALLALALAGPALAGEIPPLHPDAAVVVGSDSGPKIPDGFGTSSDDISTLSFSEFFPRISGVGIDSDVTSTGTRWITGGPSVGLYAPLRLDNGVLLRGLEIYYRDTSATDNLTVQLCRYWRDTTTGQNPGADCIATFTSAGTPGDDYGQVVVPTQFQSLLRRFNVDGDPAIETVDYVVIVLFGATDGTQRIAQVRPFWRRQVSPAPLVATFPNDVPTTHPFFRFIEALAASGITAGCGVGSYCPDNPITRGEMAVFMAAALGLHWSPF